MNNLSRSNLVERRKYVMKEWMAHNKGLTLILAIVVVVLLVAVVAGPGIWSAILAAHGM
jgi:hypothetical protein